LQIKYNFTGEESNEWETSKTISVISA